MDVNCAVHLLEISSTQKWKNRHLKQCRMVQKREKQTDKEIHARRYTEEERESRGEKIQVEKNKYLIKSVNKHPSKTFVFQGAEKRLYTVQ